MASMKTMHPDEVKSCIKKLECGDDQASSTPNKPGSGGNAGGKGSPFKKSASKK